MDEWREIACVADVSKSLFDVTSGLDGFVSGALDTSGGVTSEASALLLRGTPSARADDTAREGRRLFGIE